METRDGGGCFRGSGFADCECVSPAVLVLVEENDFVLALIGDVVVE